MLVRREAYSDKACVVYQAMVGGQFAVPTVQFILMADHYRFEGYKQTKPCYKITGQEFVMHTLSTFDLDITRYAIFQYKYFSNPGGVNVLQAYFDPEHTEQNYREFMVWVCGPRWPRRVRKVASKGYWRAKTEEEKRQRWAGVCQRR